MKSEILKSAKGKEQEKDKPAKPPKFPKPRHAHMPRKESTREKENNLKIELQPYHNLKTAFNFLKLFLSMMKSCLKRETFCCYQTVENKITHIRPINNTRQGRVEHPSKICKGLTY